MELVDSISWRQDDRDMICWRYPERNLTTNAQLVVAESQEAIIFNEGRMLGKFGPGRHTLDTKNLPILNKLFGLPFGGKNPFAAEVWFVSKIQLRTLDFRLETFNYHDPDYKVLVPLAGKGRCGVKVADSEKFLKKVVGTSSAFSVQDIVDYFAGDFSTKVVSSISASMQRDSIGIQAVASYLGRLSSAAKEALVPFWNEYGLELISFNLTTLDVDNETEAGRKINNAIAEQSAQSIAGYTWQQKQMFDTAGKALSSDTEFGILGALMMAGGGVFGGNGSNPNLMASTGPSAGLSAKSSGQVAADAVTMIMCSKCSRKYPSSSKYCPYCGDVYNACPVCGYDNDERVSRCVSCGAQLVKGSGAVCPNCGQPLAEGAAFCGNCGASLQKKCPRCHAAIKSDAVFCPNCGKKF